MTWTIIYRGDDGTTQMLEVEAASRTDVYPTLTKKGIHPLSIQPGSKSELSGKGSSKRKKNRGDSGGSAVRSLFLLLLALALLSGAGYMVWLKILDPGQQDRVRESLRPPGKVSIQISEPTTPTDEPQSEGTNRK